MARNKEAWTLRILKSGSQWTKRWGASYSVIDSISILSQTSSLILSRDSCRLWMDTGSLVSREFRIQFSGRNMQLSANSYPINEEGIQMSDKCSMALGLMIQLSFIILELDLTSDSVMLGLGDWALISQEMLHIQMDIIIMWVMGRCWCFWRWCLKEMDIVLVEMEHLKCHLWSRIEAQRDTTQ